MFDRATESLIRSAPALDDLDLARLPLQLTDAYAKIVSLRVRMSSQGALSHTERTEIQEQLSLLQRLANTYETLACLGTDEESRRSCAFVAATAHQVLHRAIGSQHATARNQLHREGISSRISALLLFFIAGAFPDANEVASQIAFDDEPTTTHVLVRALVALAQGQLASILSLPDPRHLVDIHSEDFEDIATEALWKRLYDGVRLLARDLLASPERRGSPTRDFELVRALSVSPVTANLSNSSEMGILVFGGPHHLATLLLGSAASLIARSITQIAPPSDTIDTAVWQRFLEHLAMTRPCLWPNHLDALQKGFLIPGTSAAISFPTGAGKSTLVQLKIQTALQREKRTLFLVPTHALEDQVRSDLRRVFPEVRLSGTIVRDSLDEEEESQVDVMTPERCLAKIGIAPQLFQDVGLIIFDECHLLHPRDDVFEDHRSLDAMLCLLNLLILAPQCDVVLLSAMMANAEEIKNWLSLFGARTCLALDMDWKPTRQARGCVVYRLDDIDRLNEVLSEERAIAIKKDQEARANNPAKKPWSGSPPSSIGPKLQLPPFALFSLRHTWLTKAPNDYALNKIISGSVQLAASMASYGHWYLTPNRNKVSGTLAAGFAASGIRTMVLAQTARDLPSMATTTAMALRGKRAPAQLLPNEQEWADIAAVELGGAVHAYLPVEGLVAIHHGTMLPFERRLSEHLFGRKDGVFTLLVSPTLAQGVNLPADAIIIDGDDRWDMTKDERKALAAHELLNAAGRAGRPGTSALGIVLVVPGAVVPFDEKDHKIADSWFDVQEVFSKSDQCLNIRDPLQSWLDRLQLSSTEQQLDQDAQYFLTRLPVSEDGSSEAPRQFLSRSLAAYHASRSNTHDRFMSLVEHALQLRTAHAGHTGSWHDNVSAANGVPVAVIRELDEALSNDEGIDERDVLGWIGWWFGWLREQPERARMLLGERLLQRLFPESFKITPRPDSILHDIVGQLEAVTVAWVSGAPLNTLDQILRGGRPSSTKCDRARSFAVNHVVSIAYSAGIVARVRSAQIENIKAETDGGDLEVLFLSVPASLTRLYNCIREGFPSLEHLALHEITGVEGARVRTHAIFSTISNRIPPAHYSESPRDTRRRVRGALEAT